MNIQGLANFFKKESNSTTDTTPEGYCPNCWGRQEYGPTVRTLYADKQIDVNNKLAHYGFIQEFVVNKIDGIRLKKGKNSFECPTCSAQF